MGTDRGDPPSSELDETLSLDSPTGSRGGTGTTTRERALGGPDEAPQIGRFSLLKVVGEGGMGTVYAAYDSRLDRRVALKLVKGDGDHESHVRMLREAQAMAKVSHPNVVPIFDVGQHGGHLSIAMEFIEGRTLSQWWHEQRPSLSDILAKYRGAGRGLAAAHAEGIVHRDFKPNNAIIGADGRVRVLDFGLAGTYSEHRLRPRHLGLPPGLSHNGFATPLTETGTVMGTPAYMSPEQAAGGEVDHRSDQFSFCVALWEAVYGARPFQGQSTDELFRAAAAGDFDEPADHQVPAWLSATLKRGLSTKPGDRWPTMELLLEQLSPPACDPPRRLRWGTFAAMGLLVTSLAGLAWQRAQRCRDVEAELDDTWNPDRRQALRETLTALEAEQTTKTSAQIDEAIDTYARDWRAHRREICEENRGRVGQSQVELSQLVCLKNRQQAFEALVHALEQPTRAQVASALDAVDRLPTVGVCCDEAYVIAQMSVPEDAARRAEVEAIRDELSRFAPVMLADDEQLDQLIALERRAQATQFSPVQLQVLNLLTRTYIYMDDLERARQTADRGYPLIGSTGDTAQNLSLRAMLYDLRDDPEHAILASQRALSLLETSFDQDSIEFFYTRMTLGHALQEQGEADKALEQIRLARQVLNARGNERHPQLSMARNMEHSLLHDYRRQLERARQEVERSERVDPPDPKALALALLNLGVVEMDAGNAAGASASVERALELIGDAPPGDSSRLIARSIMAQQWLLRGEYERALELARAAPEALDGRSPNAIMGLLRLEVVTITALAKLGHLQEILDYPSTWARDLPPIIVHRLPKNSSIMKIPAYIQLGRYKRAVDDIRQLLLEFEDLLIIPPRVSVRLKLSMGYASTGLGRYDDALVMFDDAEALLPDSLPDHPVLAQIATYRALTYWRRGEYPTALHHFREARERLSAMSPQELPAIELARSHIAAVQWTMGARQEALTIMRDAAVRYHEALGGNAPAAARVWGMLALVAKAQGDPMTVDQAQVNLGQLERANPGNTTIASVRALLDVALAERRVRPAKVIAAADTAHDHGLLVLAQMTKDILGAPRASAHRPARR